MRTIPAETGNGTRSKLFFYIFELFCSVSDLNRVTRLGEFSTIGPLLEIHCAFIWKRWGSPKKWQHFKLLLHWNFLHFNIKSSFKKWFGVGISRFQNRFDVEVFGLWNWPFIKIFWPFFSLATVLARFYKNWAIFWNIGLFFEKLGQFFCTFWSPWTLAFLWLSLWRVGKIIFELSTI